MLTPEQYTWLVQQRQALEVQRDALNKEIAQQQARADRQAAEAAAQAEREAAFSQLESAAATELARALVAEQRRGAVAAKQTAQANVARCAELVAEKRAEVQRLGNLLALWYLPALKSELRAYERAHEG